MKTGPDALGTAAENKYEAQSMKTEHSALDAVKNEFGSAIHENRTRRRRYLWKWVR
jgi:hypothetical protein